MADAKAQAQWSGALKGGSGCPASAHAVFDEKVALSKKNCPISKALAGVPELALKATLR